jgi:hypothetical protein
MIAVNLAFGLTLYSHRRVQYPGGQRRIAMRPLILSFTLLLVGCKHDSKAVLPRTLSNDEWFVESWDPPMATIRNHSNIYKVRCKASYLMFNHDPHVPQTLWQQQRPCGELISRYVGKIVTSASEFGPVEVTEGADSLYEFLSRMPDADGWVTEMALDEGERILEIQKNVPPKTDEFGGVVLADKAKHWVPDTTKHKEWYRETYTIISIGRISGFGGDARGQDPNFTNDAPNGVFWRAISYNEKAMFLMGIRYGAEAGTTTLIAGILPVCPTPVTSMDKWFAPSTRDLIREIDGFYSNAVNLPLPMADGAVYSIMKLNGASNQQLDNYRSQELREYPN